MPQFSNPEILHRDGPLIALHKPSGWLTHSAGTEAPDLATWLKGQALYGFSPLHRLDAGCSGIVLFAASSGSSGKLSEALEAAEKSYVALVFGTTRDGGVIKRPLQDARRNKQLSALTRYKAVERFERGRNRSWTLLDVRIETGRKHQIRRHLQGLGHALVGDDRYRPRGKPTVPAFPGRLWLHARKLVLPGYPAFECPLPEELEAHLRALREPPAVEPVDHEPEALLGADRRPEHLLYSPVRPG